MPASLRPVALITGASSGIGRQFAQDYAAKGFDLVVVARSRSALDSLAAELTDIHGNEVVVTATGTRSPELLGLLGINGVHISQTGSAHAISTPDG